MKCQKCAKPAVVHLTEVNADPSGGKRSVEVHLCLAHAVEAGLVAPGSEVLPQMLTATPVISKKPHPSPAADSSEESTAIIPQEPQEGGLVIKRSSTPEVEECPICGLSWSQFKHAGLMGCPHDFERFEAKLSPLLKRAQEGATQHVGKVPAKYRTDAVDRQVASLRLRKELQKAIDAENYEQAAQLRDKLRQLERN